MGFGLVLDLSGLGAEVQGSRVEVGGIGFTLLGGSWVVTSWVITLVTLLITPLIAAHEPPSNPRTPTLDQARMRKSKNVGFCGLRCVSR